MKLDELARTSSAAARTSVARLEPPPIEGTRSRAPRAVLAGATVGVLLIGGLVLIAQRGPDAPVAEPAPSVPDEVVVPRLGLDPESSGWIVTSAYESIDAPAEPEHLFAYYGDADGPRPFADDDVLVVTREQTGEGLGEGEEISVRGTTGVVTVGEETGLGPDTTVLSWDEPDGPSVILASRHADADRLAGIASGLSIDAVTGSVALDPALGLDLVATSTAGPLDVVRGDAPGYVIAYRSATGDDDLTLAMREGSADSQARILEWWTMAPPSGVSVDGEPAFLVELTDLLGGEASGQALLWRPAPGVIAELLASGTDPSVDLVAIAETVVEIDDTTWATYLAASEQPDALDSGASDLDVLYGEGGGEATGELGLVTYAWSLGEQDGQLCFNVSTDSSGTSSCQERLDVTLGGALAASIDRGTTNGLGYQVVATDPTVEDLRDSTGTYPVDRFEAVGLSWFVAFGPADKAPSLDVIVDGQVVESVDLSGAITEIDDQPPATDGGGDAGPVD